jgi:hypothetical protein
MSSHRTQSSFYQDVQGKMMNNIAPGAMVWPMREDGFGQISGQYGPSI